MAYDVETYMSKDIITAHWTESMNSAYSKMTQAKIRHLPVVNDKGLLVGIISDRDFQRAMVKDPSSVAGYYDKVDFDSESKVRDFMSQPVRAVDEKTDLKTVARLMVKNKISAVLVVNAKSRPVGIITHEDLLKVLVEILDTNTPEFAEGFEEFVYNSPVGPIATSLSQIGI